MALSSPFAPAKVSSSYFCDAEGDFAITARGCYRRGVVSAEKSCESNLDYATVDSIRSHVTRLIDLPKAFPFLQHQAKVFRGVDQLLGAAAWIRGIHRENATR